MTVDRSTMMESVVRVSFQQANFPIAADEVYHRDLQAYGIALHCRQRFVSIVTVQIILNEQNNESYIILYDRHFI